MISVFSATASSATAEIGADVTGLEGIDVGGQAGALELTGLRRRYGDDVALDGLSFTVAAGQVFGFLGPNGAGKTR